MLKLTEKYTDYNGVDREEDFYFNFNEAEIIEMELSEEGGLAEHIKRITAKLDGRAIIKVFKDLVLDAYGEKSADGKRFIKNNQLKEEFKQTEAYSNIFMRLATDSKEAAKFINGIVPAKMAQKTAPAAIHPAEKK